MKRRLLPFVVLAVLTLGTGLGVGLGLSVGSVVTPAPSHHASRSSRPLAVHVITCKRVAPRTVSCTGPHWNRPQEIDVASGGVETLLQERGRLIPKIFATCLANVLPKGYRGIAALGSARFTRSADDFGAAVGICNVTITPTVPPLGRFIGPLAAPWAPQGHWVSSP